MAGWEGAVGERGIEAATVMSDMGEDGVTADLSEKGPPSGDDLGRVKGTI